MFVARVLVVAAAAALKIRTSRLNTSRRSSDDLVRSGTGEAWFLFEQHSFDLLALQNEGHEGSFASAMFIHRQSGESVATVDELFNSKFQDLILQTVTEWADTLARRL